MLFLKVLEGLNAVLAKAYSTSRCILNSSQVKTGSSKKYLGKTLTYQGNKIKIQSEIKKIALLKP